MRVLFADDHALLRDTLKAFLEADGSMSIQLAVDVPDALRIIRQEGAFDLVLLDYHIPGMDGLLGLRQVIAAQGDAPVILLTGMATAGTAEAALRHGALAVLSKTLPSDKLKDAIIAAVGRTLLPQYGQGSIGAGSGDPLMLTPRQEQVLRCICNGMSNKAIAHHLKLQENTVKMYVKMIFAKLNVNSRTQAVIAARDLLAV